MSPRTEAQFEVIREKKKQQIRKAGLRAFSREGYHATTISKIAKIAGISKGLIYNYYESKEELLKEILQKGMEELEDMIDPDHDGRVTPSEIKGLIEQTFDSLETRPDYWKLYFSVLLQPAVTEKIQPEINMIYESFLGMAREYFRETGSEDPEAEALILGSILDGVCFHFLLNPDGYPLDKVRQKLLNIYGNKKTAI
jgi:AcrR family transcriptional regulator